MRVPGDKSISHRALMLAALGCGRSRVRGVLESADLAATVAALRRLGAAIPDLAAEEMVIEGVGLRGLRAPDSDVDCGNSGTTTRLLAGIVAGAGITARFVGDASLSRDPCAASRGRSRRWGPRSSCRRTVACRCWCAARRCVA